MDHATAQPLISDLLHGRLAAEQAGPAWAHLARCPECQEVLATMHELRAHAAWVADQVRAAHPGSEELVRFALGGRGLATDEMARIAEHVDACAACAEAAEVTRRAEATAGRPARARVLPLPARDRWPRLVPALAAAALVLVFPAYLGLVELPRVRREAGEAAALRAANDGLERQLGDTRQRLAKLHAGGGAALLYLPAARRGQHQAAAVAVRDGQGFVPVLAAHPVASPPDRPLILRVLRLPAGTEVWRAEGPAAAFWDPANRGVMLLVPAASLPPGDYRLEILPAGGPAPEYSARFAVRGAAP